MPYRSSRRRWMLMVPMLVVLLLLGVLCGCGDVSRRALASASDTAVEFGLRDRVVVPVAVDVLLDPTLESPGQVATWESTFAVVLPVVLSSNGLLRAWVVTPDGVALVASFVAAPNTRPGTPARIAYETAERQRATDTFTPVARFLQRPAGARSPLFAVLTMVAAETTPNAQRHLVVVSDGREYDRDDRRQAVFEGVDWECQPITPFPVLTRLLDREHFLLPGTLRDVGVHWTYFRASRTPRCRGHEQVRQDDLTMRWRDILQRAGASTTFSTGPITSDLLKGAK